jgi:heme exporter protein D
MGAEQIFRNGVMSVQEFFAMGGYAFYVWTAYGITLAVLAANILIPVMQRKQWLRRQLLKTKRKEG